MRYMMPYVELCEKSSENILLRVRTEFSYTRWQNALGNCNHKLLLGDKMFHKEIEKLNWQICAFN